MKEYPWFLETYDSYLYAIQRADSLRYFLLAHYGGIYLDLDDVCDFLRSPLGLLPRGRVPLG
jgi:inositol phosphorylceramide mannosyltransferase catalytic subunit